MYAEKDGQKVTATAPAVSHPLTFDWLGAVPWTCSRCGAEHSSGEMTPRHS